MKRQFSFSKLIELIKEYRFEYEDPVLPSIGGKRYHRHVFAFRLFFVWIINWKCKCGNGIVGYEYKEACDDCDGFALNVHFNLRQIWIDFWKDKNWEERSYYEFHLFFEENQDKIRLERSKQLG